MATQEYLASTVGPVLAEAVASSSACQASDPVAHVGQYLLKHVANIQLREEMQARKAREAEQEQQEKEQLIAAQRSQQAVEDAKRKAVDEVCVQRSCAV